MKQLIYILYINAYTLKIIIFVLLHVLWQPVTLLDTTILVLAFMVDMCLCGAFCFNRKQNQTQKPFVYGNITYQA